MARNAIEIIFTLNKGLVTRLGLLFPIVNQENAKENIFLKPDENIGKSNTFKYQAANKITIKRSIY
jgi:hypothetical protein